jgi:hypothetical protein
MNAYCPVFYFFLTGIKTPCAGEISAWAARRKIEDTRIFCAGIEELGP